MNSCYCSYYSLYLTMDKCRQKHSKIRKFSFSEVSSIEWEFIDMTDQEQDIITRMHNLVGTDSWKSTREESRGDRKILVDEK
ncbi:hypothetical protein ACS0TY_002368 [Phlomoides rotata]